MSVELKDRTQIFSISIIELAENIGYSIPKKIVINQLVKSGTSVGANYRAACRGRSDKEFIAKLNIVLEEVDETCFWLEIIKTKNWINVEKELKEANELTAIFVTMLKKMNQKIKNASNF
jgi:four helix bundle protein